MTFNYHSTRVTTYSIWHKWLNASTDFLSTTSLMQWPHTQLLSKNSIGGNYSCVCKTHYASSVWWSNTEIVQAMAFIPVHLHVLTTEICLICTTQFCFIRFNTVQKSKGSQPRPPGSTALTGSHTGGTNTTKHALSVHLLKKDVKAYFGGTGGRRGEGHLPCPMVSTFWTAFSTSRYMSTVCIETLKFKCRKGTIHVYKCHALHLKRIWMCACLCVLR